MPARDLRGDLALLVRSRHSLIALDSPEEDRALELLHFVAADLSLPLFSWSVTKGLCREPLDHGVYGTEKPALAFAHVMASPIDALYVFRDLAPYLEDRILAQKLRDAAEHFSTHAGAIVLIGGEVPRDALGSAATVIELPPPGVGDYNTVLDRVVGDLSAHMSVQVTLSAADRARLLNNLRGLTLVEAERIFTKSIMEDGRLTADDLRAVVDAKRAAVERDGLLEYSSPEESMSDVVGLASLKAWLEKRREVLEEPERAAQFGLTFPKGLLLLGMPGCGKSLCAKAVAMEWKLPLLKLDAASLYDKYIGESERHFAQAMETAEHVAPVVLWIDEVEKAFASGDPSQDGGVSTRILGTFLSWMQDRTGDVFVVATANDVAKLPPELLRKGRFDEIFFVDLPGADARRALFALHLRKRNQRPEHFDLAALVAASQDFSGAEIEQSIVSALYTAFSKKTPLTTELLVQELQLTHPLSQTMAERLDALREWAHGRAVPAE